MSMKMQALGLIETRGFTAAVEALDVAVKTANVALLGIEFIGSGLVTIQITGDVSAVKVSIDAAVIGAKQVGEVVAAHVIPRPYDEIAKLMGSKKVAQDSEPEPEPEPESEPAPDPEPMQLEVYSKEALEEMKVVEIRTLLRTFPDLEIKRSTIKYMNKEELLEAVLGFYEQNDLH